jgi:cysteinyl-tRNA synthetase
MKLYSTLDRKIVEIVPIKKGQISIYSCGPTVYYRMQIGNIRAYINWDILHRAFLYLGYDVKRIMNITDVGHMTSDDAFGSDFGEDKMDKQAQKEGLQPLDIANKYIDAVLDDFRDLNILAPNGQIIPKDLNHEDVGKYGFSRATECVEEMINMIKKIEKNGYTYETKQALYFDVTKIKDYTIFTGQSLDEKNIGAREEVSVDAEKKNPADFVLWMKRYGKYENHIMNWESPWGNGFPGWHIECSAMSTSLLGEYFDIHTGGVDHIPVHHTNERAQNIGAFNHPAVKYWIHNEWVVNKDDSVLSKSKGNTTYLPNLVKLGFDPMDIRYFLLSINYRTRIQFSIEALEGAKNAREALVRRVRELGDTKGNVIPEYIDRFKKELEDNLNMSGVLALINELLKEDFPKKDILATILDFDKVLALNLRESVAKKEPTQIPSDVKALLEKRMIAKREKNYEEADKIRNRIEGMGYKVLDTPQGQKLEQV